MILRLKLNVALTMDAIWIMEKIMVEYLHVDARGVTKIFMSCVTGTFVTNITLLFYLQTTTLHALKSARKES